MFKLHHELQERRKAGESSESGFTLIELLIVIVVLVAIYWFMTRSQETQPAKTGMFDAPAPIEYSLQAAPSPADAT